jgi:hypothetical protein
MLMLIEYAVARVKVCPTSAKRKARKANAVQATTDNIQTPRNEVLINRRPRKTGSDVDCALLLVDDDLIEADH